MTHTSGQRVINSWHVYVLCVDYGDDDDDEDEEDYLKPDGEAGEATTHTHTHSRALFSS